jgi:putative FmdB family regulatory protein
VPTYAYACSECEHAFDVRQSFSDAPLTTCPRCERESLRKVFSPVGVVFKGSGFYRNDSRAATKAKSSDKAEGNGAETKPAAKAASEGSSGGGAPAAATSAGSSGTTAAGA